MVDNTHAKLIETDSHAFVAGDIYSGPTTADGTFTIANTVPDGKYAFTVGEFSVVGSLYGRRYFRRHPGTSGSIPSGVIDANNGGSQIKLDVALSSSTLTVDAGFGRVTINLLERSGRATFRISKAIQLPAGSLLLVRNGYQPGCHGRGISPNVHQRSRWQLCAEPDWRSSHKKGHRGGERIVEQDVNGQVVTVGGTTFTWDSRYQQLCPRHADADCGAGYGYHDCCSRYERTRHSHAGNQRGNVPTLAYYIVGNTNDRYARLYY